MLKLIFGREPKLPTGKKLAPLWEALRKDPQAWVGIELAELKYNSPSLARANVRSAAHREDLAVDVIIDGTVLFARITPGSKSFRPTAKAAPAPPPQPAPVTPEPIPARSQEMEPRRVPGRPKAAKDPQLVAFEMEKLLGRLIAANDPERSMSLDLGGDAAAYSVYEREMHALAAERKTQIETDRKTNWLLVKLVASKKK